MSMTTVPLVSLLKERLQWHQTRQKLLAENVSNADTPGFKPKDLQAFSLPPGRAGTAGSVGGSASVGVVRTDPMHLASTGSSSEDSKSARRFETRPSGNAVNIDDEMLKVAENQSEYQLATSLYQKSLAMLKQAAGVRGG